MLKITFCTLFIIYVYFLSCGTQNFLTHSINFGLYFSKSMSCSLVFGLVFVVCSFLFVFICLFVCFYFPFLSFLSFPLISLYFQCVVFYARLIFTSI